jgi:hypothetical protein
VRLWACSCCVEMAGDFHAGGQFKADREERRGGKGWEEGRKGLRGREEERGGMRVGAREKVREMRERGRDIEMKE